MPDCLWSEILRHSYETLSTSGRPGSRLLQEKPNVPSIKSTKIQEKSSTRMKALNPQEERWDSQREPQLELLFVKNEFAKDFCGDIRGFLKKNSLTNNPLSKYVVPQEKKRFSKQLPTLQETLM
jgi:hypothetical protein